MRRFFLALSFLLFSALPAAAHHVVWLDFALYDLSRHPVVNGNAPPTPLDEQLVRDQVIANIMRDYAAYDISFTLTQPTSGLYTRVTFLPNSVGSPLYGCAGGSCCFAGNCTGLGSWNQGISGCEVYVGTFRQRTVWQGNNATTERLATGIAGTASHELGHILGLSHCFAADDFFDANLACNNGYGATADQNQNDHLMATGATGILDEQRASSDRFFSVHSSRRRLTTNLQGRNQAVPLGDTNGDGRSDLTYACVRSRDAVHVFGRSGKVGIDGGVFGGGKLWSPSAGTGFDHYLVGDVTGDGRDDLVIGNVVDATTVAWTVRASTGMKFGAAQQFSADAGSLGDRFRLGDFDADGDLDLIYGRADTQTAGSPLDWFVALSNGSAFGAETAIGGNRGIESDYTVVGDVNGDGRADLVALSRGTVTASVFPSNGATLDTASMNEAFGAVGTPDIWMLSDADGDGSADLVLGTVLNASTVRWEVVPSTSCAMVGCFGAASTWNGNAGDAGDIFRTGFIPGDASADLFYARSIGQTSLVDPVDTSLLRWYARASTGTTFDADFQYSPDAGAEGWMVP